MKCGNCYGSLKGTDEQIQMDYYDAYEQEDEIIKKCGWEDASYICYECFNNWAHYVK
jgi:predicted glycosyltransferase